MILTAMKKIPATSKGWYYEGTTTTLGYFDSYTDAYLAAKEVIGNTCDFLQESLSLWINQAKKHESRW